MDFIDIIDYKLSEESEFDSLSEFNKNSNFSQSDILILHVNIRSIRKNLNSLEALLNNMTYKPEIIIICTEARLDDKISFMKLPGYLHVLNKSRINICDGVVIYIKETLQFQTVNEKKGNLDATSVILQLSNSQSIKITGVYRCHDYDVDSFNKDLKQFLLDNINIVNHVILGDINQDLIKFNKKTEEYFYLLLQMGYQSMINSVTHPNAFGGGSCLDHIFVKSCLQFSAGKIAECLTDHFLILLAFYDNNAECKVKEKSFISKNKFIRLCHTENWDQVIEIQDPEEALNLLVTKLQNINSRSLKNVPRNQLPRKSWMTPALVNSVNKKNKLYKAWKDEKFDKKEKEKKKRYFSTI